MTFEELYNLIAERKRTLPEGSGTTVLLTKGFVKILPKLNEEAFEVGLALESEGPDDVALEVSQCFYYLICLAVFLDEPFDRLDLKTDPEQTCKTEHELAKQLARDSALLCHSPSLEAINKMNSLLFQSLILKKSTLEKMFSNL